MELKQCLLRGRTWPPGLLIVPYGIETKNKKITWFWKKKLLIVPYGIETAIG